jgi:hypothetical protein
VKEPLDPFGADVLLEPVKITRAKRERHYEDTGNRYAKSKGFEVYKVRFVGQSGFPDRLYMKKGKKQLWWEWKRPDEKPEPLQYTRMTELRETGAEVGWSDNVQDFKDALDRLDC